MKDKKQNPWIFFPTIIFMVAVTVAGILLIIRQTTTDATSVKLPVNLSKNEILFEERLKKTMSDFGIPAKNMRSDIDLEERRRTITIRLPKGKLIEEFAAEMFDAAKNTEYQIIEARHIQKGRSAKKREYVAMTFANKKRANEKIYCEIIPTNEITAATASAAFIIRDLDKLTKENADALLLFAEPLNYIITPLDENSIAPIFSKVMSPVLLDIPIEEKKTNEAETHFLMRKYTIMSDDSKKEIGQKIKMLTNIYPRAVGLFAKTGNLVLNTRESAKNFIQVINSGRNNLIFFDARPARYGKNGVCREVAHELSAAYDTISIILPTINRKNIGREEWELEIKNAVNKITRSRASVVMITADDAFVPVFLENLSFIRNRGIEFVPITQLKGD